MKSGPENTTAEILIENISHLLRQELELHEGLRGELTQERDLDGELNGPAVLRAQQRKYHLVGRIEALEEQRMSKVRELARVWDEPVEQLTLRQIIARAPHEPAEQLSGYHKALLGLLEEIRVLAHETGTNASSRLKAVEATLSVVGDATRMHPTYSDRGRLRQKPPAFKSTSV